MKHILFVALMFTLRASWGGVKLTGRVLAAIVAALEVLAPLLVFLGTSAAAGGRGPQPRW